MNSLSQNWPFYLLGVLFTYWLFTSGQDDWRAERRRKALVSVDPDELELGIEVEQEHTDDLIEAEQIALDHLSEMPDYYTRLTEMEKV